jgi:prevent-host-death family protein
MARRYSIAEARQEFARLVRRVERGRPLEITRRGRPVAVLVSASEYLRLAGERPSFAETVRALRERLDVEALGIGDLEFRGLREGSAGREVGL